MRSDVLVATQALDFMGIIGRSEQYVEFPIFTRTAVRPYAEIIVSIREAIE